MAGGLKHDPRKPQQDSPPELVSAPASATGVLTIDLHAIQRNYRKLCVEAGPAECAAVVKADAYGLGTRQIAAALAAAGCRTFFVATLAEAIVLRQAVPTASLYVLNGLFPRTAPMFRDIAAQPVLGSMEEIKEWAACMSGAQEPALPAALHIDTGMNRLGVKPADYAELIAARELLEALPVGLVMSHLACADAPEHPKNAAQGAAFAAITAQLPPAWRSLANSPGLFLGRDYAFDLVRPGVALYGGNPFSSRPNPMQPVVCLYGRIAQLGEAERGETVGYGAARTLTRRTRYAAVTAGYADGYSRALGSRDGREGAVAWLGDCKLPILGRVSMDLIVFDVTDVPENRVVRGGWVELIGERFTVDDAASCAGTIAYDVLTSLGQRYHRIYTGLQTRQEPMDNR